jgi:hypothetical protein
MAAYLEGAPVIDFKDPGPIGSGRTMPDPWGRSGGNAGDDVGD